MFRTTLKHLAARKLRLLTTSLAVLLGVAFMAGTLVLTDTISQTFDNLFTSADAGTDVMVRREATSDDSDTGAQRGRLDDSLTDTIAGIDGVAAAEGHVQAYAQLLDKSGTPLGNPENGAPTFGWSWINDNGLNPFAIDQGRPPRDDSEIVIDKATATAAGYQLGDTAGVLTQSGRQTATIVGTSTFAGADSAGGAQVTMFTLEASEKYLTAPGMIDAVKVAADDGVSAETLAERIDRVLPRGTEAITGDQLTSEDQTAVKDSMSFFYVFLTVFALIALLVGSFIIYNTFSILVAQRTKEMALLRALGASRRQVLASVLLEATFVGLIASAVGILGGIGVALGLKALLDAIGIDMPSGPLVVSTRTILIAAGAGLGVSIASAVLPARRAARVEPIAAMRDEVATPENGRRRLIGGIALTAVGAAVTARGLTGEANIALVGLGSLIAFVGVVALGPAVARPISWLLGAPLARWRGAAGLLARENAMRHPKRTAATSAALMIGVSLVVLIAIMASSMKASINDAVESALPGDIVIDSGAFGQGGLSTDLATRLSELPEIGAVSGIRMASAQIGGSAAQLYAGDVGAMPQLVDLHVASGSLDQLGADGIAVSQTVADEAGWTLGEAVPVRFAETGTQQLRVAAVYTETQIVGDYFVDLAAYESNIADQFDQKVLIDFADGVDAERGRSAITAISDDYPLGEVQDLAQVKAAKAEQIDMLVNLVYALLSLAVLIALLGIANTLALSIFERTRETGLLRAVGMTRGQLKATIRYESVIIALLGTTLGLGLGLAFSWAFVTALRAEGLDVLSVPIAQLAAVVVIAAFAGVVAAVVPARRAARLDVLTAIGSV